MKNIIVMMSVCAAMLPVSYTARAEIDKVRVERNDVALNDAEAIPKLFDDRICVKACEGLQTPCDPIIAKTVDRRCF